jgi:Electron transfer DM13
MLVTVPMLRAGGVWRVAALVAAAAVLVLVVASVVAFAVVPQFVRSSVVEPAPSAASASPASTEAPASSPPATVPPAPLSGQLRRLDPVHYGSGRVTVVETGQQRYLRFEDVDIAGAPNMFVYLSDRDDGQPGRYTDLGPLRATSGSFNYDLPTDLDLPSVRSVVVWCRAFSVTVTYAPLTRA